MGQRYTTEEVAAFSAEVRRWVGTTRRRIEQRIGGGEADAFVRGDLDNALEELTVSEEELHAQCDELREKADEVDRERTRYRMLFEFLPLPAIVTDLNGTIRETNQASVALLGVPPIQMSGKPLAVYIHTDDRKTFRANLGRLARLESVRDWSATVVARGGAERAVTFDARQIPGSTGADRQVQWIARLSDHAKEPESNAHEARRIRAVRTAAEIAAQDSRYLERAGRVLLDAVSTDTVEQVIADLACERLGECAIVHLLEAGPSLRRAAIAKKRNEDGSTGVIDSVLDDREIDSIAHRVSISGESEVVAGADVNGVRANGHRPAGLLCIVVPLSMKAGRVLGALTIIRTGSGDHAKALLLGESLARQSVLAIASSRAFANGDIGNAVGRSDAPHPGDELLADLIHEIRSPVNAILSYCDLFMEGRTDLSRLFFERIQTAARHQLSVIQQVSQAKARSATENPTFERVDLRDAVRNAAAIIVPTAQPGIDLRVVVPEEPVYADTEPGWIRQILINLLSNAVDFTRKGTVSLSLAQKDHEAVFRVADTGIGMTEEQLKHLYDRGQESASLRPSGHGTGLGLSIANDLAESLNASIDVESRTGQGTTFIVRLPLARPSRDGVGQTRTA